MSLTFYSLSIFLKFHIDCLGILFYTEERDMAETEDRNSFDERTIYLGHVSESHYISLRPKCWRQELRNGKYISTVTFV